MRDGGISPAETAVRIWELLPRPNLCEAATSQSRWDVTCNGGQRIAKLKRMEKRDTETANIDTKSANNDKKSVIVDTKSAGNGTRSTDNGTQIANNGIQSTNNGTQTANNGIKRQNDGTPTFSFCNKNKTFGISRFINSK